MAGILIAESDEDCASLLTECLKPEGYRFFFAWDGVEALYLVLKHSPDLVLLDVAMPRMDGWETCYQIRQLSEVPIIMISGQAGEMAQARALDIGADVCVSRPIGRLALAAQVRAMLRRSRRLITSPPVLHVDECLTVDRVRAEVRLCGRTVSLSPIEFKLLCCFLDHPGRLLAHQSLLTHVWGWEYADQTSYLKVHIHSLRKKIEPDPAAPRYILTEWGLGYRFQFPE